MVTELTYALEANPTVKVAWVANKQPPKQEPTTLEVTVKPRREW
jgi:hypothetical protein